MDNTDNITGTEILSNEVDILAELQKATQEKVSIHFPDAPTDINTPTTPVDDSIKPEFEGDFNEAIKEELKEKIEDAEQPKVTLSGKYLAPLFIDGVEMLNKTFLPIGYKKTLSDEDAQALKLLAQKYRHTKGHLSLSADDQRVIEIYCDYEEYVQNIPFKEDEKKQLLEPLELVLNDANVEVSPTTALIIAVLMVMFPRIYPLFKNYSEQNKIDFD